MLPRRLLGCSRLAAALAVALALQAAAPAVAQEQARSETWYRSQLVELADVLGGAHYLRTLCGGRNDQRWRDYMRGVIRREPSYQNQLVEAFNRGYRREQTAFNECGRDATQTEAELRARGLRVAQTLSARHAQ